MGGSRTVRRRGKEEEEKAGWGMVDGEGVGSVRAGMRRSRRSRDGGWGRGGEKE